MNEATTTLTSTDLVDPSGHAPKDRKFGINDNDFWDWYHQGDKKRGDPDGDREQIWDAYEEWKRQGRPPREKRPRRRWDPEFEDRGRRFEELDGCGEVIIGGEQLEMFGFSLGVAIAGGTILEDFVTGGAGLLDDPATLGVGAALISGTSLGDQEGGSDGL